ncbi:MAG: PLDc N-terminal domain-containing protein [Rhodospirillaceae bacterium]|nr:PLDc N-terminal domain-containing protein [Rhodospirillaceae bacterium]
MSLEINGIFGLLILVADIWAIVSTVNSSATTGKKVGWILLVLILPLLGVVIWYFAGPRSPRTTP